MEQFLNELKAHEINISLENENLKIRFNTPNLPPEILVRLKAHKSELITYLKSLQEKKTITKVAISSNGYPLSSSQYRLWVISHFEEASIAYNMPAYIALEQQYDVNVLIKAIYQVIDRHEILRTVIKENNQGEIRQWVLDREAMNFKISCKDMREKEDASTQIEAFIEKDSVKPFSLSNGPLLNIQLFRLEDNEYALYANMHHIISDDISKEIFVKEIMECYAALIENRMPNVPKLTIQYKDFAVWQQEQKTTETYKIDQAYWKEILAGTLPVLDFIGSKKRPKLKTYHGKTISKTLSEESSTQLKRFVESKSNTLFVGLLAVWKTLFYRYTGHKDILVGIPTSGRVHKALENQIGFYLNALALRTTVKPETTFLEFIEILKNNAFTAYKHQAYPFEDIVNNIDYNRDISRSPIFDILIDFHSTDLYRTDVLNEQSISGVQYVKYDLEFHFVETEKNILIQTSYNTAIYEENSIQQFLNHFEYFVDHLSEHIHEKIDDIEIITSKEKHFLLTKNVGKDTKAKLPEHFINVFQSQCKQTPNNIAVKNETTELTYTELDRLSSTLANHLISECNIQQNDVIAIQLDHNQWVSVALLGILKAGATFICIDPELPEQRKELVVNDAKAVLLISETNYMFDSDFFSGEILAIDVEIDSFENTEMANIVCGNIAYLIYTSGSTGTPKGVEIGQKSLINYLQWGKEYYGTNEAKNFGVFTTLTFDLTITSLFLPLITGGTVTFFDTKIPVADTLKKYLKSEISYIKLTPAHLLLLQGLNLKSDYLQHAIIGGDTLETYHLDILEKINPRLKIYNEYGPTEATVGCIVEEVPLDANEITIGLPINNTEVYILNKQQQIQPINVAGELYIGGESLAIGYKNNIEQQQEKFISNPFQPTKRLYKTGDIAKWLPNGKIAYLGREDDQVKINGYRIELGEIEQQLLQKPSVEVVKILAIKTDVQKKTLFAFVVSSIEENINDLRNYLLQTLPEYMVPSRFFQLESLPLTRNGKIDKTALLAISEENSVKNDTYQAPETAAEKTIATIWQEELQYENVGIHDDFFSLGGDSILAIRVLSKINTELKTNFQVADLFLYGTIKSLLEHIPEVKTTIPRISEKVVQEFEALKEKYPLETHLEDLYPMSDIEIGMSYAYLLHKGEGIYHDQFVYPIFIVDFNMNTFEKALNLLIKKHDVLRTSYDIQRYGIPMRLVHKNIAPTIEFLDLTNVSREKQETHIEIFMKKERENSFFDIEKPGIWKMDIFKIDKNEHFLVFQFHHAILDGWSRASLITELNNIYFKLLQNETYVIDSLSETYKEYVLEQESLKQNNTVQEFWNETLSDYKRLECFTQEAELENTCFYVEGDLHGQLQKFSKETNISIRNICFSMYAHTLQKLSYHTDILVGMVTSARPLTANGDKILGCFLNSVPIRLNNKNCSLLDFVKETDALLKKTMQYDKLSLAELSKHHAQEEEGNPFFDTLFNYVDFHVYKKANFTNDEVQKQGLEIDRFEQNNTYLDLIISPIDNGLFLEWDRSRKLKSGLTNTDLVKIYLQTLKDLVNQETQENLKSSCFYDEEIKHKILYEFNTTQSPYPETENVISLFENQVQLTPKATALVYKETTLSYQELNEKATQFAHFLQSKNVKEKDIIGIKLDRNNWMIVALLGTLKAGAAYVPLDINYPEDRIQFMVNDCNCKLVIDNILLEEFFDGNYTSDSIKITTKPEDLVYVIYTSGSTGTPKGVMITHQNVVATLDKIDKQLGYEHLTNVALSTNIVFDISVLEIFGTLCYGKQAVLFDTVTLSHPAKFIKGLQRNRVEVLQLTPSRLLLLENALVAKEIQSLQLLIVGGEAFPLHIFNQKRIIGIPIVNVYGPSEATIWSTYCNIQESEQLSIGKPLNTDEIYILNEHQGIQPIGVGGEICIGGACVSRGYLNLEKRTKESFILNPYKVKEIIYRTGDLGRWLPDGNIEFIGREDDQVKIRGYRIELGEVEQVLRNHLQINEVAVSVKTVQEETKMIAYIVSKGTLEIGELRAYVAQKLPEYMIPTQFITLSELPLNTSGKLDRKRLPEIDAQSITSAKYKAPTSEVEKKLVDIWQELLNNKRIGVQDNFFELGGNSLQAMQFLGFIHQQFDVQIDIIKIFSAPTISYIALEIENIMWLKNYDKNRITKKITI